MKPSEPSTDELPENISSGPTRRAVLGAVGLTTTAALAGCAVAGDVGREAKTERYSVAGDKVDRAGVSGGDGKTIVRGWDGTDVRIAATKYARGNTSLSDVRVTRDVTAGRPDVGAERTDGHSLKTAGGGLEAIEVEVPRSVRVARVEIDDGDVTVGDVDSLTGELDDGALRMTEPATIGDLRADDGTLELVVGDIEDDVTVTCDDGDVTAQIASTIDATVVVKADDAPVRTTGDLFNTVETTGETISGQLGDGRNQLTVEVDDGAVQLRPL